MIKVLEMKASDYIVKYLENTGIKHIYGYIGGAITPIVDSIYKSKIRYVHCYHEQAAAFSASAVAKLTNSLQATLATSGPGATNLITGIADAYFDSSPVLFITGQVNTYDFKYETKVRQKGFQETDIVKIVKPITKYAAIISHGKDVEKELKKAVSLALSGRKGPVLLDITMDVQRADIEINKHSFDIIVSKDDKKITEAEIKSILDLIKKSKFPLILAGGGCSSSQSHEELKEFSEKLDIPVIVSLMGKDSFPHEHRLFGGFIGAYGNRYGNILLSRSDLLIVLGSRLDKRQTGNNLNPFLKKKIIWVDIDINEIKCSDLKAEKAINLDVKSFFKSMLKFIETNNISFRRDYYQHIVSRLKQEYSILSELKRANKLDWHYRIMLQISKLLKKGDVICVDVGQNQMLAAQTISIAEGQRFINSGGMAPLGYSLPAAIGISTETKKQCIVFCGDGGMQINIQELNTVIQNKLPIIIIILNNYSLGMIKQFQELYFDGRYCGTDQKSGYYSCDFNKIGNAYGIPSFKLSRSTKNPEKMLSEIFSKQGPLILEIEMDYVTHIFPKLIFDRELEGISPNLSGKEKSEIDKMFSK
jgi:acetolactate synthase-1/2/3 large subunit